MSHSKSTMPQSLHLTLLNSFKSVTFRPHRRKVTVRGVYRKAVCGSSSFSAGWQLRVATIAGRVSPLHFSLCLILQFKCLSNSQPSANQARCLDPHWTALILYNWDLDSGDWSRSSDRLLPGLDLRAPAIEFRRVRFRWNTHRRPACCSASSKRMPLCSRWWTGSRRDWLIWHACETYRTQFLLENWSRLIVRKQWYSVLYQRMR